MADDGSPAPEVRVRQAREDDHGAVTAFTERTWPDRDATDYIPRVFPEWVDSDGPDQRTVVAELDSDAAESATDDTVVGLCQGVMLSEYEAWAQGMRVHPDYRGAGISHALNDAVFTWAADRGATICRNMVFSWNVAGLGTARGVGFDPGVEFRWLHPAPDPDAAVRTDAAGDLAITERPDAAWSFWQRSDARDALGGLALDLDESWALREVTRDLLHRTAAETRLLTVEGDGGVRGLAYRVRDYEREADDAADRTRWAEYGLGAWADLPTARALVAAIRRDAAAIDADETRVLIPETPRHVSDAAAVGVDLGEHPDFVLEADLSDR